MPTILLVEDDIAFCNMLKTFLQKKGFEVDAVYDTLRKKTYVNNEIMKNHKKNIKSRGTTFREGL